MSEWLDPTGHSTFGIGICGRCNEKYPLDELHDDPNTPGLKVCVKDMDEFDPYRLPARAPDDITLPFTRPDVPLEPLPEPDLAFILADEDGNPIVTEDDEFIELDGLTLGEPKVELP